MRVVHCKRESYSVYIGRPSALGNPYVIGKDGDRTTVISKFENYARNNSKVLQAIDKLQEHDVLGCWCSPHSCHGNVIIKIWKERRAS